MFGWLWRKKPNPIDDVSPEVKGLFNKMILLLESEAYQNSLLPAERKAVILSGVNCDKIPGGYGEFGRDATNPIPANGPLGQIIYLSQLRTAAGKRVMFHRIGSTTVGEAYIDMYEVLSTDDKVREYLYMSLYHPRKSRVCPSGYKIERKLDYDNPIYGVNRLVENFPEKLDIHIRDWQERTVGMAMSVNQVRMYLYGDPMPWLK